MDATATKDKYDDAIDWLVAHPLFIGESWSHGGSTGSRGEVLFQFCNKSGEGDDNSCGCLTMIRSDRSCHVFVPKGSGIRGLTREIRAYERIPCDIKQIAHYRGDALRTALQPFAEWQRRLDREIRNVPAK